VVGVGVRLEDMGDLDPEEARQPQVLADVDLRVHDRGDAGVAVADEVRRAAEVVVDELAEDHALPPPTLSGRRRRVEADARGDQRGIQRSPWRSRCRYSEP
jgi:hypothetical protein